MLGDGLVRMIRTWNEWLIVWGYDISQPPPDVDARTGFLQVDGRQAACVYPVLFHL
jgi:hypothetical protein